MERPRNRSWRGSLPGLALAGAGALFGLGGCASSSQSSEAERAAELNAWTLGPLVDAEGNHRSLAIDSRTMQELQHFQPWLTSGPSWYDSRLDRGPSVAAGTRRVSVSISETITRDRFSSSNGRVQDNYSQNVIREKFIEVVR